MNKTTKVLSLSIAMFAIVGLLSFPQASANYPDQGCTPGFYKANAKKGAMAWPENLGPNIPLANVGIVNTNGEDLTGVTLLDALKYKGGNDLEGAERIFLRASVAAFLNAAQENPVVNYPGPGPIELRDTVINPTLALDDRDAVIAAAKILDKQNNLGCPLYNND